MIYKGKLPVKNVKSVGAIIINDQQKVLILFQKQNRYWEFPKGKVELGEENDELDTLRREIFEEAGLKKIKVIKEFRHGFNYQFKFDNFLIKKNNIFYLAKTIEPEEVVLSDEHLEYKWVSLPAVNRFFKHKNQRVLIYKLREFLSPPGK
ncbi:MAG: NUDIX domain-containing protein [Patescibacteria group bacterium]